VGSDDRQWEGPERRQKTAEDAADSAVRKVFAILGVDIDKPESVEDFREDLRFGRRLRKIGDHATLAFIGIVAVGVAAAIWTGILSMLKGGHQ
jgi:hypothetical protein